MGQDEANASGPRKRLLTYAGAADLVGKTAGAMRAMVRRRQVPHVRLSKRTVRFDADDLEAWIAASRQPAGGRP